MPVLVPDENGEIDREGTKYTLDAMAALELCIIDTIRQVTK